MQRTGVVERVMREYRVVLAVVLGFVVYGGYAFFTMPRQEFPEFRVKQGLVVGLMPGATSRQVEERLTRPIEQYLFSFKEVNKEKTYSLSQDGRMIVFVELDENVYGPDAPAFWAKLRLGLNELRLQSLPTQVVALVGNNDFGDVSALLLTLVSDGHSPRDVEKQLRVLEDHLRRIPATSKLRRYGEQQEVIRVTIDQQRLARYGVRPATVWMALQGVASAPAGFRVDGPSLEIPVHVEDAIPSEQKLADTILISEPGGSYVRLKDIAAIVREYGHDDSTVRYNGRTAIVLSVEMLPGHDITRYGEDVEAAIADARRDLPQGVEIARVADQPKAVRTSINHFLRDFGIAIVAVIGVTMLLLPLRVASVAAITIPVSIFSTIGIISALGVDLQTVSLAGLVVVLGMVVDNAIVVVDDHVERLDRGADPWTAAWKSARELFVPMLTATAAIVMAYVPNNWFLTGVAADFAKSLPLTVGVALTVSLVLAVTLVPILDFWLIKKGLHRQTHRGRPTVLDALDSGYGRALERAFHHPALILLGLGAGSVAVSLLVASGIDQQLFPKVDRNQFAVEVYLPPGRPLAQTDAITRRLETLLLSDKRVTDVTAFVGCSSPRFHAAYAPEIPARNYAQLLVNTTTEGAAVEVLREYSTRYDRTFPDGWVRFYQIDMLLAKAPIEVRITGDDIPTLKSIGARIQAHARTLPGVTWVRDDYGDSIQEVSIKPDRDACSQLGVTPAVLQTSLAMASGIGIPLGTVWEGDYPVKVILGEEPGHEESIDELRGRYVPAALVAAAVPLEQLAEVRPAWDEGTIVRRNGVHSLAVRVDVASGQIASHTETEIERYVASLGPTPGIRITYGGERMYRSQQYPPMTKALITSVVIIYFILLFQFRRHLKALLVMVTMPLALLGAVIGLVVTGSPFGFTAFVGVISLMGIVVRNGIILVDYADALRANGISTREAALAAGKRRMRPIFLTSAAAAVGVVPMILSRSTLWMPLGAVTAFGLTFSMVLTLFVLPVAYWKVTSLERRTPPPVAPVTLTALCLLLVPVSLRAQEAPLTLGHCKELAARQSYEVRSAQLDVSAADETRAAVRTRYFPQVSADAVSIRSPSPLATIPTPGGNLPVLDIGGELSGQTVPLPGGQMDLAKRVNAAALVAVQPLLAGGRIVNGNRLAALGADVAREGVGLARRDAIAAAEEKYWGIIQLQQKLRTLAAYQGLLDQLQKQADDAVRAGVVTRNDALKVEVQRRKAAVDHMKLESGIHLASRDLRRHIGLPAGDSVTLAEDSSQPEDPAALAEEGGSSVDRRPEIRQLERAVAAAGLQTALKRGEALPTVSVGAAAMHDRIGGIEHYDDVAVFATVSIPLSGIWETSHNVAAERMKQGIAEARLADVRAKIQIEIDKCWADLQTAWDTLAVARTAIEQAGINRREESDQYKAGLVTVSDLLEAEVLYHQAADQVIDARIEYWLKRSAYLRATGRQ